MVKDAITQMEDDNGGSMEDGAMEKAECSPPCTPIGD